MPVKTKSPMKKGDSRKKESYKNCMAMNGALLLKWSKATLPPIDTLRPLTIQDIENDIPKCQPLEDNPDAQEALRMSIEELQCSPGIFVLDGLSEETIHQWLRDNTVVFGDNDCWGHKAALKKLHDPRVFTSQQQQTPFYAKPQYLLHRYRNTFDPKRPRGPMPRRHRRTEGTHRIRRKYYTYKGVRGLTRFIHYGFILSGQRQLVQYFNKVKGKNYPLFDASHLCAHAECYRPSHIVFEKHAVNLQRARCLSEWHQHSVVKNVETGKKEIHYETLACDHGTERTRCLPHLNCPITCAARCDIIHWSRHRLVRQGWSRANASVQGKRKRRAAKLKKQDANASAQGKRQRQATTLSKQDGEVQREMEAVHRQKEENERVRIALLQKEKDVEEKEKRARESVQRQEKELQEKIEAHEKEEESARRRKKKAMRLKKKLEAMRQKLEKKKKAFKNKKAESKKAKANLDKGAVKQEKKASSSRKRKCEKDEANLQKRKRDG